MAKKKIDFSPGNWPTLIVKFLSSFGLATVVLIFLTLITLLGTLDQVDNGLVAAKRKYFDSFFLTHNFGGVPVPLPGGLLLMMLLFANILVGALIKVRKRKAGIGTMTGHIGILFLLAGGFVTHVFATDGYIAIYPGMESNRASSYREWQLEIIPLDEEGKGEKAVVIPTYGFSRQSSERIFNSDEIPFAIVVNDYARNARPVPISAPISAEAKGREIDGFKLLPQELRKQAEQNLPGAYVEFRPPEGEAIETILWAGSSKFDPRESNRAFGFEVDGKQFAAQLAKKTWEVPFKVRLDKFIFDKHPGISTARNYESRITRIEEGQDEKPVEVRMNEPMRYAGYTFFQESFGPSTDAPELYSQFAVANNPADQWPLYALVVITIGMTIQFLMKLMGFTSKQKRTNAKPSKTAS